MAHLEFVIGPSGVGKSAFAQAQKDWQNVWNLDMLERTSRNR